MTDEQGEAQAEEEEVDEDEAIEREHEELESLEKKGEKTLGGGKNNKEEKEEEEKQEVVSNSRVLSHCTLQRFLKILFFVASTSHLP